MARCRRSLAMFVATLSTASAASAAEPYYFYKAGVDRATFVGEVGACIELAGGVKVNGAAPYSPNLVATAVGAFFSGIAASRTRRALTDSVIRTCMVDKGYRRFQMSDEQRREVGSLEGDARLGRLHELAAATEPTGMELPQ